jgi:hypothetical protein
MNEIEETKASSKPTPQGTEDPDKQPGDQNGGAQENGDPEDEKLAEIRERNHPFT